MKNRISFYVKYQEGFTEDLYKKLWNWSVKNSLGLPRGWCDTYERLKEGHCFIFDNWGVYSANFDKDKIKEQLSYGVDNNSQCIKKELSIKEVIELIGTPSQLLGETDKQYKVGDWVLVKGRCGNGLSEDKILKLIAPDDRIVWGHSDPDYYFEWNNELKGLREEAIIRPARPEEIPQEEVEYVECISAFGVMGFTVNKIYRCRGKFPTPYDSGKENHTVEYDSITWRGNFKPSTREAYEAQQKGQWKVENVKINVSIEYPDKEVNKCSTINKQENECKSEKVILRRKTYTVPRGKRKTGSKVQAKRLLSPSKSRS